ncbi:DGC domain-containing protein [groundwater metagenome]
MAECCIGDTRLIYSCSGGSNVGEIADRVVRKMRAEGLGRMTCLASIGAHLSGFVESAKGADENITIDGCPVACAKKNLEHVGIKPKSIILTEMGLVKGKTPVNEEIVDETSKKLLQIILKK